MSNILDSALQRRQPVEGPHGKVVGSTVVNDKLCLKIIKRIKGMAGIEALLILTMTSFDLAVVPGSIRPDQFVPDV